ncbi:hypothetical protein LTR05_000686 [Lithohypha guttulata]|uniref:HD domain-containing protein n=1 Tax=Lithohypha guttulata TaxID=1690604 RepID=A0AAN7YJK9_9EURO|nr:hypothetical protein LTR05_000686 [Lithohypha guttulata]
MDNEQGLNILARLPPDLQGQIPDNIACNSTLNVAAGALPEAILNHSLRVYLLAKWLADKEGNNLQDTKLSLLFLACICHDFGASDQYNGSQRFEIEGADAASNLCASHGIPPDECHKVWTAIALHTSPGIAERIDPFTRLVRLGVKLDFSQASRDAYGAQIYSSEIELLLPRLHIEKVLADAVVKQARKIPDKVDSMTWPDSEKHPKASWPGMLLRAHIENVGYNGVNPAF